MVGRLVASSPFGRDHCLFVRLQVVRAVGAQGCLEASTQLRLWTSTRKTPVVPFRPLELRDLLAKVAIEGFGKRSAGRATGGRLCSPDL